MAEKTNISKSTESIHIYDVIMRAVTKLPDKEKEVLMSQMTINQLASLLTSKEKLEQYTQNLVDTLDWFTVLTNAITSICKAMSESIDGVEDIISDFDKLSSDKKKEATLKLMNNSAFQKDCCEILVGDMERIFNEDANFKAFNDIFNITEWCKKMIKQGIGLNHKYNG